jgi:glycosyltransferase involved in cell wall biosynthesis
MKPQNESSSKRLRVAVIGPSLRYVGGQSVQADLLLRFWRDDPDVEAKFIAIDPPLPSILGWAAKLRGVRTGFREPLYWWHVWRGLADVEIAHVFSASYWSFLLAPAPAWFLGRLRSKKVLIHYHSGEARDHLRRFGSGRLVLSRVDDIVVPSGYLVEVFREFELRGTVIPNLVDLSQFHYRERTPLRPHLVCTRGFHPYYCVEVVVKAFAKAQREIPDARLDLVGNGPSESDVRKLVADLQLRNVNFCGVVSRSEIGWYYEQADIFINASRLDNMPVSVIEAFASGTVVVSTSPEAMPYLVDDRRTGLLSPVGDENALADNVIRLMREPELARKLAQNAYAQSQKYAWAAIREQWIRVYRTLLQRAPAVSTGRE